MSEVEADINLGITLLLSSRPGLAAVGIAVKGTHTFIETATRVLQSRGLSIRDSEAPEVLSTAARVQAHAPGL